jgi:hypothetical protein
MPGSQQLVSEERHMASDDHSNAAPFPPGRQYAVPLASLALSLPTLVLGLALSVWTVIHALTGRILSVTTPPFLQSSFGYGLGVRYFLLGPTLGAVLCLMQRSRARFIYGSVHLLGFRMKRLNTLALCGAGLAMGALALLVVLNLALSE